MSECTFHVAPPPWSVRVPVWLKVLVTSCLVLYSLCVVPLDGMDSQSMPRCAPPATSPVDLLPIALGASPHSEILWSGDRPIILRGLVFVAGAKFVALTKDKHSDLNPASFW